MAIRVSKNRVFLENIPLNLSRAPSMVASTVVNLASATGNFLHITGSSGSISSFGTVVAGSMFVLVFDGTPTILFNGTSMILNSGGTSYTCSAGDRALLLSEGSGKWVVSIIKSDGTSVVSSGGGSSTGGVSIVTSSRSLTSSDNGKTLTITSVSDMVLTIPAGLPNGFGCAVFQSSTGTAIIGKASGITVFPVTAGHTKTGGQNKIVAIVQVNTNTYSLSGGTS